MTQLTLTSAPWMSLDLVTAWFARTLAPSNKGVYEIEHSRPDAMEKARKNGLRIFSYWNGARWMLAATTPAAAAKARIPMHTPINGWRGLLTPARQTLPQGNP